MTKKALTIHRLKHHRSQLLRHRCSRCLKVFASTDSYRRHVQRHATAIVFPCRAKNCGRKFSTKANLSRHYKAKHLEKPRTLSSSPHSSSVGLNFTSTAPHLPSSSSDHTFIPSNSLSRCHSFLPTGPSLSSQCVPRSSSSNTLVSPPFLPRGLSFHSTGPRLPSSTTSHTLASPYPSSRGISFPSNQPSLPRVNSPSVHSSSSPHTVAHGLTPMEQFRNDSIIALRTGLLELGEEQGESVERMTTVDNILSNRMIRPVLTSSTLPRTVYVSSPSASEPNIQEDDTGAATQFPEFKSLAKSILFSGCTSADLSSGDSGETGSGDESNLNTIQRAGRRRVMTAHNAFPSSSPTNSSCTGIPSSSPTVPLIASLTSRSCSISTSTSPSCRAAQDIPRSGILALSPQRPSAALPPLPSATTPQPISETGYTNRLDFEPAILCEASTQTEKGKFSCRHIGCDYDGRDAFNLKRHVDSVHSSRCQG